MAKAIFWDLQGTLGGDATGNIETFEPYPFSREALRLAKAAGYLNLILTNQSKIGKGELSREMYNLAEARILRSLHPFVDAILCCPHTDKDNCNCKKPKHGMILRLADRYSLNLSECYVIGDMGKNEVILAHNAGCRSVLVLTGGGQASLNEFRHTWADYTAGFITDNALTAVRQIIR